MPLVSQLMSDDDLDFLFLTETWQVPSVSGKMDVFSASFLDFSSAEDLCVQLFAKPRPKGRRGGGVALLCRKCISVVKYSVHFPAPSTFEFCLLSFVYIVILCSLVYIDLLPLPHFPSSCVSSDFC